jgi:hypothetical protein
MNVFTIIVVLIFLGLLWLPPLLMAFRLDRPSMHGMLYGLGIILPVQPVLAAALIFLADYIGLLNPAGYSLGISVAVGLSGAGALLFLRRSRLRGV